MPNGDTPLDRALDIADNPRRAYHYLTVPSRQAVMSPPDKHATDLISPIVGLAWPPPEMRQPEIPSAAQRRRDERAVYTVPCHAAFRNATLTLAKRRGVDAAGLVRMVLALVSPAVRASVPDPGEPSGPDRHARPSLMPVLVLRLAPGLDHATIRQALAVALALDNQEIRLIDRDEHAKLNTRMEKLEYRSRTLAKAIERLAFRPKSGRLSLNDAAGMLGLLGDHGYDEQLVTKRFRELAPIFHPDTGVLPCRERMAQLIDARNLLLKHLRAPR